MPGGWPSDLHLPLAGGKLSGRWGGCGEECRLGSETWSGGLASPLRPIGDFAEPSILRGIIEEMPICTQYSYCEGKMS